jgi:hypothetical protein
LTKLLDPTSFFKRMGREQWQRAYLNSSAVILLTAATFKVLSLLHQTPFLEQEDSVFFFFTNFQLLCVVILIEVIVAGVILFPNRCRLITKLYLVAWLASLFCIYRFGLLLANDPRPCKCFGNLFGWLGLSDEVMRMIVLGALLYLLVPSVICLTFEYKRRINHTSDFKISNAQLHE